MQGHLPVVECLCTASADVNKAANNGSTPLLRAAEKVSIQSKDCMHVCNSNALSDDNTEIVYKLEYVVLIYVISESVTSCKTTCYVRYLMLLFLHLFPICI